MAESECISEVCDATPASLGDVGESRSAVRACPGDDVRRLVLLMRYFRLRLLRAVLLVVVLSLLMLFLL